MNVQAEKERLVRLSRYPWFHVIAPRPLRFEVGCVARPPVDQVVDVIFQRRDLGSMRALVDGVRVFADDEERPSFLDADGSCILNREAAALRGCLARLELMLALQVTEEAE